MDKAERKGWMAERDMERERERERESERKWTRQREGWTNEGEIDEWMKKKEREK